jgi:SAM-dependent methyltransferase
MRSPIWRHIAARRIAALPDRAVFALADASAEDTGMPGQSADIVTASQAMHWFDPGRALPEIARLLRPGGVLAAYDCDWPPAVNWQVDAAYTAYEEQRLALEIGRGLQPSALRCAESALRCAESVPRCAESPTGAPNPPRLAESAAPNPCAAPARTPRRRHPVPGQRVA